MMGTLAPAVFVLSFLHILVVLAILLLIFGPGKLAELGKGLGEGIRNFKSSVNEGTKSEDQEKK